MIYVRCEVVMGVMQNIESSLSVKKKYQRQTVQVIEVLL